MQPLVTPGDERKATGMALALGAAQEYAARASSALHELAASGREFTADDVYDRVGLPNPSRPNENNAVGAAFSGAARGRLIIPTGRWVKSRRRTNNSRMLTVWVGNVEGEHLA